MKAQSTMNHSMGHAPISQTPLDMIRPVLWMAAAAFAAGFGGYLMLGLRAIHPVAG